MLPISFLVYYAHAFGREKATVMRAGDAVFMMYWRFGGRLPRLLMLKPISINIILPFYQLGRKASLTLE